MNEKDRKQIRQSIIEQISELETDLEQLEESAKPISPDNAYGRLSRMDAINNKAIVDAALASKRTTLQSYKNTLEKIESDQYGKCVGCGNTIAAERLMSIPYADFCITCAARRG
jgi:DnaK suppressor protein